MMWEKLLTDDAWRALLAGVLYVALTSAGGWLSWAAVRWTRGWVMPGAVRVRLWRGWRPLGRGIALAWALAYPYGMLLDGTYAASDVGVGAVDWPRALPWAMSITLGAMALLLWLWRERWPRTAFAGSSARGGALESLSALIRHEALLITLRASLMPLAGGYWGIWLAIVAKWALLRAGPWGGAQLAERDSRPRIVLHDALDWVSATLYVYVGSAWASLAGRALCYAALMAQSRRVARRARDPRRPEDAPSS